MDEKLPRPQDFYLQQKSPILQNNSTRAKKNWVLSNGTTTSSPAFTNTIPILEGWCLWREGWIKQTFEKKSEMSGGMGEPSNAVH